MSAADDFLVVEHEHQRDASGYDGQVGEPTGSCRVVARLADEDACRAFIGIAPRTNEAGLPLSYTVNRPWTHGK